MRQTVFLFVLSLLFIQHSWGQEKYTLSGHIRDASSGEELLGASIWIPELSSGTSSNLYGFYSLTLKEGNYHVVFNYVGFDPDTFKVDLSSDQTLDADLSEASLQLDIVEIKAKGGRANVESIEMSTNQLPVKAIKKLPALFGEVDIMRTIQLLPGITSAGEGVGGFFVRGGGADQNLVQLDEAPVYNAYHLLGFFSVFNADAIKDVKVYKGGIPAEYGGRLSSLVDVRMKEGNSKKFEISGGIGAISSRLAVEGPIVKDKVSFLVTGRRTYADVFIPLSNNEDLDDAKLYFYDVNTKINYRINNKHRIFLSGYFGKDVYGSGDDVGTDWSNATATARWNYLISDKIFSNLTFIYSKFNYNFQFGGGTINEFEWRSHIRDFSMKLDLNNYINPKNTLKFGGVVTHHKFNPGKLEASGESIINEYKIPDKHAIEGALYISNEQKWGNKVTVQYGLRYSMFEHIGKGRVFNYTDNFEEITDTVNYGTFKRIKFYHGLEPRFSLNYTINSKNSIKTSYNRTRQYVHLISPSSVSLPWDIWVPSDKYIEPKKADQVTLGYFRNFLDDELETSVELYYKRFYDLVDYRDNADLLANEQIERELLKGSGYSYGAEFLVKRQAGSLTGWVSYTISRTRTTVPGINNGKEYRSSTERMHDLSIVLSYNINEYINIGANWVYTSGAPATYPAGRFQYGNIVAPIFTERNEFKIPAYHRMDFSMTLKMHRKPERKWKSELNFSLYNVYGRKNAFSIEFEQDEDNPQLTKSYRVYLFRWIPSVTYNFHFQPERKKKKR